MITRARVVGRSRTACALRTFLVAIAVAGAAVSPAPVSAQVTPPPPPAAGSVTGGDFDICDYCGNLTANTAFLVGRPGFGTQRANFILINADEPAQDVDRDGFTVGV